MRCYNGKPLVNSVNGKKESMEAVVPLVKRYGGLVVCLTLDENGIPDTADGRLAIAEKILKEARVGGSFTYKEAKIRIRFDFSQKKRRNHTRKKKGRPR